MANKTELDFNKNKREEYENLMDESSTKLDGYWDRNNPAVVIILAGLAVIIVLGVLYYVAAYLGSS